MVAVMDPAPVSAAAVAPTRPREAPEHRRVNKGPHMSGARAVSRTIIFPQRHENGWVKYISPFVRAICTAA